MVMKNKINYKKLINTSLILSIIGLSIVNSLSYYLVDKNNPIPESQNLDLLTENSCDSIYPRHQISKYTDDSIVACIKSATENVVSEGVIDVDNIIGEEEDGLLMTFEPLSLAEHALLKLNSSITSDKLILKGFEDYGDILTALEVYGWIDPYVKPSSIDVNDTGYSLDNFILLGNVSLGNEEKEIILQYDNTSLEYLLLIAKSDPSTPLGGITQIDAIEVQGFVSIIRDEDKNGTPDIWQYPDVNMDQIITQIDLFGLTYEIMSMVGTATSTSSNYDFLLPFIKLGIIDEEDVVESHYYVICQVELKLPFQNTYEYLQFLNSYDLVNLTYIEEDITIFTEVYSAFDKYIGQDHRIRSWHLIDYTIDGIFNPMNYAETSGQITGSLNTLDTKTYTPETAQEKFDLDVSIVLDIVENVLDAIQGGKDLVEQFMSKIAGFIQGKILDGVSKALLEKITKKALKSAIKAILSITTIKDIIVKGSKILEKLGVTLPDWLTDARDFIESIPFIDPAVEIWKVRLSFINESNNLPILGYDYENNISIYTHPEGIYFGDTYSAQVILSSRDIFPVIGRIQSLNASRTITGRLYVEDFGLMEATYAKSSLEPGEYAKGRIYSVPPNGSIVISQCQLNITGTPPTIVEADSGLSIKYTVTDENGTSLTDINKNKAAINNLPSSMIELAVTLESDGRFCAKIDSIVLDINLDYHMVAILYKTDNIFHDWWNYSLLLQDTIAPRIQSKSAEMSSDTKEIYFSAKIIDYSLNYSNIIIKLMDGTTNDSLATSHQMIYNGTDFVFNVSTKDYGNTKLYYKIEATDSNGNTGTSDLGSIDIIKKKTPGFTFEVILIGFLAIVFVIQQKKKNR